MKKIINEEATADLRRQNKTKQQQKKINGLELGELKIIKLQKSKKKEHRKMNNLGGP